MSRRPAHLFTLAAAGVVLAAVVWICAFTLDGGRRLDAAITRALLEAATRPLEYRTDGVAELADPLPFVLIGLVLVTIALLRGRPLMALTVAGVLGAANVTTQILKPALADDRIVRLLGPDFHYPAAWPSGHATAAMSLALCAVLVAGPTWRWLAATLGAAYAVGIGYSLVALGWHLPSDVLGGYLVAASSTLAGAGLLALGEQRWPGLVVSRTRSAAGRAAPVRGWTAAAAPAGAIAGGLGALSVAAYAALTRAPDAAALIAGHGPALAAGAGIAGLGIALTAGFSLVVHRSS